MKATVYPSNIQGSVTIPGSKSHTIRALLIALAAEGTSTITNYLDSADTRSCIEVCRAFGADVEISENTITVTSPGIDGLTSGNDINIDVGNSGTTLYLAAGLAALTGRKVRFTGDEQIRQRPIEPLMRALRELGAETRSILGNGCAPVEIRGPLRSGEISIECPTSQYLSSLLLCAPLITPAQAENGKEPPRNKTVINIPLLYEKPYVEITLRWLFKQGVSLTRDGCKRLEIPGGQQYVHFSAAIPADFSSASFFLCAAAITGKRLTLIGLDPEDPQGDKAVMEMLERMGCIIVIRRSDRDTQTITITGPDRTKGEVLKGCEIDMNSTPDALPIMAVTACFAKGETRLINVPQARLKETDRITVMREVLTKMGADITELEDGLVVLGSGKLHSTSVDGHGDHRVVMALAVAALAAEGPITISTAEAADVTFPGFFRLLRSIGSKVEIS